MVPRTTPVLTLTLLIGIGPRCPPAPAAAQDTVPLDSAQVLRRLHSAQASFEATRRRHLRTSRAYRLGPCDEEIGRICFWHDDDPLWAPPPEDERIGAARRDLLRELELGAALHPGDRWIVGQRVRYLVEDGDSTGALAAARECQVAEGWCTALEGFVWHTAGDYAAAEASFDLALRLGPDSIRCAWTDLSGISGPDRGGRPDDTACTDVPDENTRTWWLADPLFSVPGNERRTEHFARLVMIELLEDAATPSGMSWGDDKMEVLLRFGWSVGWSREFRSMGAVASSGSIIGHHRRGSRHFMPPASILEDPSAAGPETWEIDVPRPVTRYAPAYATVFGQVLPQLALFARGDSAIVVTAFGVGIADLERATVGPFAVGVAYQEGHTDPLLLETGTVPAGGTARLSLAVPRRGGLLSVEALSRRDSLAARTRHWLAVDSILPPGQPSVGLLFVETTPTLPRSLSEAASLARPTSDFRPGEPLTVYWETAEFPPGATRTVSLTVVREAGGFLRRAAAWLGLASRERTEVTLGWEEGDPLVGGAAGRAVTFDIPDARDGEYRIRLTARSGAITASTEKAIRVRR
jgi:hypothetical protein